MVLSVSQREKAFKQFDFHFHLSLAFPSGKLSEERWKIGERSCTFPFLQNKSVFYKALLHADLAKNWA